MNSSGPKKWLTKQITKICEIDDSPHSIAIGIAIGCFFGFIPVLGLKTLLTLGITRLARGNVIAAVIAVTLHDLLIPLDPLLLIWEYKTGCFLLGIDPSLTSLSISKASFHSLLHSAALIRLEPVLIVGSAAIALPFSLLAYFLTASALRLRTRKITSAS